MLVNCSQLGDLLEGTLKCESSASSSVASEGVEALVGVANERQAHFRALLARRVLHGCLGAQRCRIVRLWNLINGKVLRVNVGLQLRLKWGADLAQAVPIDAAEKGMALDLSSAKRLAAKSVLGVADEAVLNVSVKSR
jgi:hypothetical protein